jgi:hypothetical protein
MSGMDAAPDLWSVAEVVHDDGQVTTVRFRQRPSLETREALPEQFTVEWAFEETSSVGLPTSKANGEAAKAEALFVPHLQAEGRALLVVVSTGEGVREWFFYCRDSFEMQARLNEALSGVEARFPVKLHSGHDPEWRVYEQFVAQFERRH